MENTLKTPYELFGIECGKGWKHLYEPVIKAVNKWNEEHKDEEFPMEIMQIKEKYGTLRIYLNFYTDEINDMIDKAEEESYHTCEICGKRIDGPIDIGWIYPMCEECFNKSKR